jgi:GNAT superfamily N-acetyltransferase
VLVAGRRGVARATLTPVLIVRRIRSDEGARLRHVRLAALNDSPSAFASTYAAEATLPAAHWSQRAADTASGDDSAIFLALVDDEVVGVVGTFRTALDSAVVRLGAMWAAPAHRGVGVGRRLVAAVLDWASESGAAEVELWVTAGNVSAQALYESTGFTSTSERQPLPSDPTLTVVRMTRLPVRMPHPA